LTFTAAVGTNSSVQTIIITINGGDTQLWVIDVSSVRWLTVSPVSASVSAQEITSITLKPLALSNARIVLTRKTLSMKRRGMRWKRANAVVVLRVRLFNAAWDKASAKHRAAA
jgi:hypothetical protein